MISRPRTHIAAASAALAIGMAASASASEVIQTRGILSRVAAAIETYETTTGERPDTPRDLGVVARIHGRNIPQEGGVPVDAWGSPLRYERTADAYRLYSAGGNRIDDGGRGDDLVAVSAATAGLRRANSIFPIALLVCIAPIAWAAIRRARRGLE